MTEEFSRDGPVQRNQPGGSAIQQTPANHGTFSFLPPPTPYGLLRK
jgi:hypothetical protein